MFERHPHIVAALAAAVISFAGAICYMVGAG